MNQIHKGFEDLEEYQDAFATNNGVLNVDRLEILKIKTCARGGGGGVIYVIRGALTHIKVSRMKDLFCRLW